MTQKHRLGERIANVPVLGVARRYLIAMSKLPETRFTGIEMAKRVSDIEAFQATLRRFGQSESILARLSDEMRAVIARLDSTDSRTNDAEMRLASIESRVASLVESLDAARNSAEGLFDEAEASIGRSRDRIEFVRQEILFELRYGAEGRAEKRPVANVAKIVDAEKIERLRPEGLRINLGCGHIPVDGYVNVDRRPLPGVDIVADIESLPFTENELAEVRSAHLLEHFPQEQLRRAILPGLFSVLRPGGLFRAIVPDSDAMIREYAAGRYPCDDLREVTYGSQDYDGDFHFNMFTPASMTKLLEETGFASVVLVEAGRKNGRCFEFEITATKPTP